MMIKYSYIIILIIILQSCGFKAVKQSDMNKHYIATIEITGDKRINYIIKNNLLNSTKNENKNPLNIKLKSKKIKDIKEKNIKNEITKYQITIDIIVNITGYDANENTIVLSKSGEYNVNQQYSKTLRSENNLVKTLANDLSKEIIYKISQNFNDL